jgi:sugar lactone lactonase YvrE
MMKKQIAVSVLAFAFALSLQAAQGPQLSVVAEGLNNPRGLAFAPNGLLFVAEAGLGAGDGNGGFATGVGFTASITEIQGASSSHPRVRRIVHGLASVGDTENGFPEALGPSGVSVHGTGGIYVTMGESALGVAASDASLPKQAARQFGHLLKVTPGGQWKAVADVGDFDYLWTEANKDQPWAPVGQFPDANLYGVLAGPGEQFVVDAGANTLDEVRANGSLRIVAFFPNPLLPLPNGNLVPVSDSVPTCVTRGPDGFLYVGTLAFGANFARFGSNSPPNWANLPAQSKIYRVHPSAKEAFLTDSDVWASGFNPITAIGFNGKAIYVTEYVTQDSHYATGDIVKVSVNPDGSAGDRSTLGVGALTQPNGLAFGHDGSIYVSNHSISAGGGQVVRVNY